MQVSSLITSYTKAFGDISCPKHRCDFVEGFDILTKNIQSKDHDKQIRILLNSPSYNRGIKICRSIFGKRIAWGSASLVRRRQVHGK